MPPLENSTAETSKRWQIVGANSKGQKVAFVVDAFTHGEAEQKAKRDPRLNGATIYTIKLVESAADKEAARRKAMAFGRRDAAPRTEQINIGGRTYTIKQTGPKEWRYEAGINSMNGASLDSEGARRQLIAAMQARFGNRNDASSGGFFETYDEAEDAGRKSGRKFTVKSHLDDRRNNKELIFNDAQPLHQFIAEANDGSYHRGAVRCDSVAGAKTSVAEKIGQGVKSIKLRRADAAPSLPGGYADVGESKYNEEAVNKAIANNPTGKIGGREARMIHALLKGSSGYASRNKNDAGNDLTCAQMPGKRTNKEYVQQGWNANLLGHSIDECPYYATSPAEKLWKQGWRSA